MDNRRMPIQSVILWLSVGVAIVYIVLTLLYQSVFLPGKIALVVYALGELSLLPFIVSIVLSIVTLFSPERSKLSYLPAAISLLTFLFLYLAWFVAGPTEQYSINGYASIFYYHTGFELPRSISEVKEFDNTTGTFFGDGDAELSFHIDKASVQQWMTQSGFHWKAGPYKKSGEVLNDFTNNSTLVFKDGRDIQYAFIDRTPANLKQSPDDVPDSTTIFVNQPEGWVLIKDYDL